MGRGRGWGPLSQAKPQPRFPWDRTQGSLSAPFPSAEGASPTALTKSQEAQCLQTSLASWGFVVHRLGPPPGGSPQLPSLHVRRPLPLQQPFVPLACSGPRGSAAVLPLTAMQDNYALTFGNSTRKAYGKELDRRSQTL